MEKDVGEDGGERLLLSASSESLLQRLVVVADGDVIDMIGGFPSWMLE